MKQAESIYIVDGVPPSEFLCTGICEGMDSNALGHNVCSSSFRSNIKKNVLRLPFSSHVFSAQIICKWPQTFSKEYRNWLAQLEKAKMSERKPPPKIIMRQTECRFMKLLRTDKLLDCVTVSDWLVDSAVKPKV